MTYAGMKDIPHLFYSASVLVYRMLLEVLDKCREIVLAIKSSDDSDGVSAAMFYVASRTD